MGHFLKSLLTLLQCCLHFLMLWFFGHRHVGILTPHPGVEPAPPALEGKVNRWATRQVPSLPFLTEKSHVLANHFWQIALSVCVKQESTQKNRACVSSIEGLLCEVLVTKVLEDLKNKNTGDMKVNQRFIMSGNV